MRSRTRRKRRMDKITRCMIRCMIRSRKIRNRRRRWEGQGLFIQNRTDDVTYEYILICGIRTDLNR